MIAKDLRSWIDSLLTPWLETQGQAVPVYTLEDPPAGIEADFACNVAMLLAKSLRKAPRQVAQEIQALFEKHPTPLVSTISIAGAGFLNFQLSLNAWQSEVARILSEGAAYGKNEAFASQNILIEFVSANPTGPLHVGHGRGAALGDSLTRIYRHLGAQVSREYYINDAGNQIQMLGESLLIRCHNRQHPNDIKPLPENGYHGDYLIEVADEFLKKHPQSTTDLQAATQFALSTLLGKIKTDLELFGVEFDQWFSEASFVREGKVDHHIETLRQKGYVKEYDDAIWFVAPGEEEAKDKDRVLKRRDGRWTYFATDIAYHANKFDRGFSKLIDIWGADHHGYVARVKGSMAALGYNPDALHVLLYQLVSLSRGGVPVSMSKRSGDFITLEEVIKEVGRDACRFFFAMRGPNTAFDFDLELAKKQSADNPVFYLQYAHARICSIFRQAGGAASATDLSLLKEKEERDLMKRLSWFPQMLVVCAQEDSPHPLATYLLQLCRQFHHFYDHHKVLGQEPALTQARLSLLRAVQKTLAQGLWLLGVSAPEQM